MFFLFFNLCFQFSSSDESSRHQTVDSGCSFLTCFSKSTDLNPAIAVTMHGVTTQTPGMGITIDTPGINSSLTSVGRAVQWQVAVDLLHYMEDMNHDKPFADSVSCGWFGAICFSGDQPCSVGSSRAFQTLLMKARR